MYSAVLSRGGLLAALALLATTLHAQQNVLQPGDPIIASSANSPGSEGVANAIDGVQTKYLNFDTRTGGSPSGFVVTPSVGVTRVVGIAMQSANDAPERDPRVITIEGSNDETVTGFNSGNWELIVQIDDIPDWPTTFPSGDRFQTQTFFFDNFKAYKHYRWTVLQTQTENTCCMQIAEVELLGSLLPKDVTQPGDALIASSANSPGSEGVANAIDGQPTKYLNFDTRTGGSPSGFAVTPGIGRTLVTGITMQSANDAPERDPLVITLEGSNDDTLTAFDTGNWELIIQINDIPDWPTTFPGGDRFQTQTFLFDNYKPYKHYRWIVQQTQTENTCCMQIAEVELLGSGAPQDVTQPGDALIASSANSPGSEGVANAIDGQPTKYLNFDTRTGGSPSGFVVTPAVGPTTVIGLTMQSANDAPERDPLVVTLEGSNDDTITAFNSGNWELIVQLDDIPDWPTTFPGGDRFQTQEFYFTNKVSYKHYRWTVLQTQTENTCCMQIAEVELLAVTERVDCDQARFLVQPVDTPALSGSPATFAVTVNGPWPLQWYRNGTPIPGANQTTYTTDPVTAANETNVYAVEIVGCELSTEVRATVFQPSATKSVGVSFIGGGANGSPTTINTNDIAGVHPQAFWNNATNTSGFNGDTISLPDFLVDSDNAQTAINVEFTSSGTWGAGTGDGLPTQRLLNGLVHANPGAGVFNGTITFTGVPAGTHSVIVYMVGIPLQFQDANYQVVGTAEQTYYVRVINADEYNAAPGYYRGISTDPANRSLATYVRFDNVQANSGTVILNWDTITTGFDRGAPVNAIQLLLNSTAAPPPPVITTHPQPTVGATNSVVVLSVEATGTDLTYQWRKDGRNLPDGGNVSGATTAQLRISNFSEADEGVYSVAVFNPGGSVVSRNAAARVSAFDIADRLVGHWKFDESGGTSAANSAGGEAAAITGPVSWGAGRIANALTFDGTATYGLVTTSPAAESGISASGWVNAQAGAITDVAFFRNASGALGVGAGVGPGTPAGQFEIGLVYDINTGEHRLSAAIGAGPNIVRATAPSVFTFGQWQHVAFSADGAQLRLYLNGVQVAFTDYLADLNPPDIEYLSMGARLFTDTNNVPPTIGPDLTTPAYLSGALDDLGLWTRALSANEVGKIYDAGTQNQDLSTVVIEPPVGGGTLTVSASGGNITVTWDNGNLETAPSVNGPWTPQAGTGSITEPTAGAAKYYRTVSGP